MTEVAALGFSTHQTVPGWMQCTCILRDPGRGDMGFSFTHFSLQWLLWCNDMCPVRLSI